MPDRTAQESGRCAVQMASKITTSGHVPRRPGPGLSYPQSA